MVALIKSAIHDEAVRICRQSPEADDAGAAGGKGIGASSGDLGPATETSSSVTSEVADSRGPPTAQDVAASLTDPVTGKKFSDLKKPSDGKAAAAGAAAGCASATSGPEKEGSSSTESTLPGIFGANNWQTVNACGPTWSNRVDVARAVLKAGGWSDRWLGGDGEEEGTEKVVPVSRSSIDLGYKSPLVVKMDPSRCAGVLRREPIGVAEVCQRVFGRRDIDMPAGAGEAT